MPDDDKNPALQAPRTLATRGEPLRVSAKRSRLAVMPLAVLLPSLGDVAELARIADQFERRLGALQSGEAHQGVSGFEVQSSRVAEESMLAQVVQWLTVGLDKE